MVTWSDPIVTNTDDETEEKIEVLKSIEPSKDDDQ